MIYRHTPPPNTHTLLFPIVLLKPSVSAILILCICFNNTFHIRDNKQPNDSRNQYPNSGLHFLGVYHPVLKNGRNQQDPFGQPEKTQEISYF